MPSSKMTPRKSTGGVSPSKQIAFFMQPSATKEEMKAQFDKVLEEGRKASLIVDWLTAHERLGEAADLSVKIFGDFASETYEPHMLYGKTLLQLITEEAEVVDEDEEEEEEEQHKKEIINFAKDKLTELAKTMCEAVGATDDAKPAKTTSAAKPAEAGEAEASEAKSATTATEATSEAKPTEMTSDNKADKDETMDDTAAYDEETVDIEDEEDDIERAQLCFEVLDYARKVCEKHSDGTPLWFERMYETNLALAESLSNDNNEEEALKELNSALDIVTMHFGGRLRELAFIHMQSMRAYRKAKRFDEAFKSLTATEEALKKFVDTTKAELATAADEQKAEQQAIVEEVEAMFSELKDERKYIESAKAKGAVTPSAPAVVVAVKSDLEDKENTAANKPTDALKSGTLLTAVIDASAYAPIAYKRKAKTSVDEAAGDLKKAKVDA